MSEIAQTAVAWIQMADFAQAEAAGKATLVGAGLSAVPYVQERSATARFSVVADVELPYPMLPVDFPVEIALTTPSGELVSPRGSTPMRLAKIARAEQPQIPAGVGGEGRAVMRGRTRIVMDFGQGIPLPPGEVFRWRLMLDGDASRIWTWPFLVLGPRASGAGAVLG